MSESSYSPSLAAASSNYRFKVTSVTINPSTWTLVVKADPARWALNLVNVNSSTNITFYSPIIPAFNPTGATGTNQMFERKFRDYPGSTGSEWYAFNPGGGTIMVTEEIFNGG